MLNIHPVCGVEIVFDVTRNCPLNVLLIKRLTSGILSGSSYIYGKDDLEQCIDASTSVIFPTRFFLSKPTNERKTLLAVVFPVPFGPTANGVGHC